MSIVGIDIGGTFTDLVAWDPDRRAFSHVKTLTSYADFFESARACLREAGLSLPDATAVRHGTTQVINAFIQRSGAKVALVTTRGFRDVLEIGRANRPIAFQLRYERQPALVPRPLRFEVTERMDAHGGVAAQLDLAELEALIDHIASLDVEAVAVSFLNSYLNPAHEEQVARRLRERLPRMFVTSGVELTREWFEYERTSTAAANAYVGPLMGAYLDHFDDGLRQDGFRGTFALMASNGGVLTPDVGRAQPLALVESGPIGGCIAASAYAAALDLDDVIAFDMGGTTAKCALVQRGKFEVQSTYYIGGYEHGFPVRMPILDIVEVGAGGGSIGAVDDLGRMTVGPKSAGSEPGPAAFGRGGENPTVTDANLLLGRIGEGAFLGGAFRLDKEASRSAMIEKVMRPLDMPEADVERAASGILQIASTVMSGAIKEITGDRGHDARKFVLFAFGGGGPLHAADLARDLHIPLAIVPPEPGNFSALGMLLAQPRIDNAQSFFHELDETALPQAATLLSDLETSAVAALAADHPGKPVTARRYLDLRYRGQKHPLQVEAEGDLDAVSVRRAFEAAYRHRFGHADDQHPVEIVGVRIVAAIDAPMSELLAAARPSVSERPVGVTRDVWFDRHGWLPTPVYRRDSLPVGFDRDGPAIIEEYGATTVIGPRDRFVIGGLGEIRIHCGSVGR